VVTGVIAVDTRTPTVWPRTPVVVSTTMTTMTIIENIYCEKSMRGRNLALGPRTRRTAADDGPTAAKSGSPPRARPLCLMAVLLSIIVTVVIVVDTRTLLVAADIPPRGVRGHRSHCAGHTDPHCLAADSSSRVHYYDYYDYNRKHVL
jgi:hypothetical protein